MLLGWLKHTSDHGRDRFFIQTVAESTEHFYVLGMARFIYNHGKEHATVDFVGKCLLGVFRRLPVQPKWGDYLSARNGKVINLRRN